MLTDRQQRIRLSGVGSSEIAAIAGENPWANAHDVWLAKRGLKSFDGNGKTWLGNIVEPHLAQWYGEETGTPVRKYGRTVRSRKSRIALASPDYATPNVEKLVECKLVGDRVEHHWHRRKPDGVPGYTMLQCQWQMGVLEVERCDVPVIFLSDGERYIYQLTFDASIFESLLAIAAQFWTLVETGEPPPVDASESCKELLKKIYEKPRTELAIAPSDAERWFLERIAADARIAVAQQEADLASNQLRALIGHAEGMRGQFGTVTWKEDARGRRSLRLFPRKDKAA